MRIAGVHALVDADELGRVLGLLCATEGVDSVEVEVEPEQEEEG